MCKRVVHVVSQSVRFVRVCAGSLLYVPIYDRLPNFIQLLATLTRLCHIKRDHPVTSADTHAFRRLQKSLIALLIVVCGKSSQICWGDFTSVLYMCYRTTCSDKFYLLLNVIYRPIQWTVNQFIQHRTVLAVSYMSSKPTDSFTLQKNF